MSHPYATDSEERTRVPFVLAAAAVTLAFAVHHILKWIGVEVPWWIDAPSPLAFYGLLAYFFDHYIWRWKWIQRSRLVEQPDLSGSWTGVAKSSYDDFATEREIRVQIEQSWTRISIHLCSETSDSFSLVAAILLHSSEGKVLSYQYRSEPHADAIDTMQSHLGATLLNISKDNDAMEGKYFSGRGRQNHGSMVLHRVK